MSGLHWHECFADCLHQLGLANQVKLHTSYDIITADDQVTCAIDTEQKFEWYKYGYEVPHIFDHAIQKAEALEMVYIITGPEFSDYQGHALVIYKSVKASLHKLWMGSEGDVDDFTIRVKDPKSIVDMSSPVYGFKLKGTGSVMFHLGCDFSCDKGQHHVSQNLRNTSRR